MDRSPHRQLARQAQGMLALARGAIALKNVPRTGWLDRGLEPSQAESVADHTLGVALLAWSCALERRNEGADIDPMRVVMLALIHDLAEAQTGDSPPYDSTAIPSTGDQEARRAFLDRRHMRGQTRAAIKRAAEDAAMRELLTVLPAATRSALAALWEELTQGTSNEARFVKQVDRLETFLQSRSYLGDDPELPMDSFRHEALETIDDPLLAAVRDAALAAVESDLAS